MPHTGIDPVVIASQMVSALQTIAARSTDPLKSVVVSVTAINAGSTYNVIPGEAALKGTIRYFDKGVGQATEERFRAIVDMTARMFGATARLEYRHGYPVTFNHAEETGIAVDAARRIAQKGAESVTSALPPMMGAEDFSFMLEARPGAMIFIGNGDSAPLHNPGFDFNDNALPFGIAYWNQVVQETMPATAG